MTSQIHDLTKSETDPYPTNLARFENLLVSTIQNLLRYARSVDGTSNLDSRNISKAKDEIKVIATSNGKNGRALYYVIKRFLSENPRFLPGFRIFPEFFGTRLLKVIPGFRKT